jgi:opacity protein-like surface antigen
MRHATRAAILAAAVFTAAAAFAHPAQAQANPISFGVTAGATKAVGDFSDGVDLGYHVGGLVEWSGLDLPFGVRLDGVYHRFSVNQDALTGSGVNDANVSITAGTLNAVFKFPAGTGSPVTPYLIGGVGFYHISASATCNDCGGLSVSDSQNKFGLNGGGGLSFPLTGFSAFVEARYHHIFTDGGSTSMVPISVGIVFH